MLQSFKIFIFFTIHFSLLSFVCYSQKGFHEGLKAEKENTLWGFKNTKGKWKIKPEYDTVFHYYEFGKAIVGKNNLAAVIDTKGKLVIPFFYQEILPEYKHVYPVKNQAGKWGLVHNNGKEVFPNIYDNFRYEYKDKNFILQKNGRWGIYNHHAQELVKPTFKQIQFERHKNYKVLPFTQFEILSPSNKLLYTAEADNIIPLTPNSFAYNLHGKLGIATSNNMLSPLLFEDVKHAYDSIYFVKQNGLWGLANEHGTILKNPTWNAIHKEGDFFIGTIHTNETYIYNNRLEKISSSAFKEVGVYTEHMWVVKNSFNLWGCIDSTGAQTVSYRYDAIDPFKNGISKAILQEEPVIIDKKGDVIINSREYPFYDSGVLQLDENLHQAWIKGYTLYQEVTPLSSSYFRVVLKNKKTGVIDKDGILILSCIYDRIHINTDKSILIAKKGKYIYCYSTTGKLISGPHRRFIDILDVSENYLKIRYKDGIGFCDYDGQIWVSTQYPETGIFKNGICPIKLRGRWGYIDKDEHLILQPYYQSPAEFYEEAGILKEKNVYHLMNSKGRLTIEYPLKKITHTSNGMFIIENEAGLFGLANKAGKEVIPAKYKSITPCANDLFLVSNEFHTGTMDKTGRIIIPLKYNTLVYHPDLNVYCGGIYRDWTNLKTR